MPGVRQAYAEKKLKNPNDNMSIKQECVEANDNIVFLFPQKAQTAQADDKLYQVQ